MPTYPTNKTFKGGFYNSKNNDRVYSAEDVRKPYDVIYTDGIKPGEDGTAGNVLQVVPNGGLSISVLPGFAKLGGAWFENTANYNIGLDVPTGTRYDCVILRNDDTVEVREPSIYIMSLDHIPTESNLVRDGNIYEVCLAYITITSDTATITKDLIIDTRTDGSLCNTMRGVGTAVVATYRHTYFTEQANMAVLPIGIDLYKKAEDELIVSVEGRTFSEGLQYDILDNQTIQMVTPLPVKGTKVDFVVHKNITGVSKENPDLTNVKNILTHDYYCNGTNDNLLISNLVKELLIGSGYGSVRLNIHGTFGGWSPVLENKTNNTNYWFDFSGTSDRRVVVDFTDCSQLITPVTSGKTNVIFYGRRIDIVGANLIVNDTSSETSIVVFDSSAEIVNCENSRFWITADKYSFIAKNGTFTNCRASVTNSKYYSYCFYTNGVVRLFGGEYYAYTADSGAKSAVVGQTGSDSITIMYGVNAPTIARTGYYQTNSVNHIGSAGNSGVICCTDMISNLAIIEHTGTDNFRGIIKLSKPGLM